MEKETKLNNNFDNENELKDIYEKVEEIRSHSYIAYCALTSDAEEPEKNDIINTFYCLTEELEKVKTEIEEYIDKHIPIKNE